MSSIEHTQKDAVEQEHQPAERVRELVAKVYGGESGDHGDEGYKRAAEFANKLKEKYPDYNRMHVWYVLVGGTPEERFGILEEDFPGEDSVVAFLELILKERHDKEEEK